MWAARRYMWDLIAIVLSLLRDNIQHGAKHNFDINNKGYTGFRTTDWMIVSTCHKYSSIARV